jgi:hypothetical protein
MPTDARDTVYETSDTIWANAITCATSGDPKTVTAHLDADLADAMNPQG